MLLLLHWSGVRPTVHRLLLVLQSKLGARAGSRCDAICVVQDLEIAQKAHPQGGSLRQDRCPLNRPI